MWDGKGNGKTSIPKSSKLNYDRDEIYVTNFKTS